MQERLHAWPAITQGVEGSKQAHDGPEGAAIFVHANAADHHHLLNSDQLIFIVKKVHPRSALRLRAMRPSTEGSLG